MIKTFSLYALAILLSLSILGPSFLALLENEAEIEIVQDVEEEKETKKELEEYEKFLNDFPAFSVEIVTNDVFSTHYYLAPPYGHTKVVTSPPPDYS